jgi:hypothetical protein
VASLIRAGLIHNYCEGECTEYQALEIACPVCDEKRCEECDGKGFFTLSECPLSYIFDLKPFLLLANSMADGLPPVAGGAMDQSALFLKAYQRLQSEDQKAIEACQ